MTFEACDIFSIQKLLLTYCENKNQSEMEWIVINRNQSNAEHWRQRKRFCVDSLELHCVQVFFLNMLFTAIVCTWMKLIVCTKRTDEEMPLNYSIHCYINWQMMIITNALSLNSWIKFFGATVNHVHCEFAWGWLVFHYILVSLWTSLTVSDPETQRIKLR